MSNPITDLKRELIAAAERQHQHIPAPVTERRFRRSSRAPRLLPIGAAVAVIGAAALFLTTPWSNSPRFLARAEAALTPPQDMILHAELTETTDCSVRWTAQIWVDERTHTYRGRFHDPFLPYPFRYFKLNQISKIPCIRGSTYEAGVVLGPRNVCCGRHNKLLRSYVPIRLVPPHRLLRLATPGAANPTIFGTVPALNPVAELRRAIRVGRAHVLGRTKLNGRPVERILVDPCLPNKATPCPDTLTDSGGYAYVDPETYFPVEMHLFGDGSSIRFSRYEYLPRTATNLALTSLRAQHPHARLSIR